MTEHIDATEGEPIYVGRYECGESVTVRVVRALGEVLDAEPASVDLSGVVDPEALDRLFEPTHAGNPREGRISFETMGHLVTVRSDRTFSIAPADQ